MNNLNSILIEGNLVRDPVLTQTSKGTSVCGFSVASNRFYKQENETQKEVSFFDVEVWSRLADTCANHLKKGRGVRVVGRLKQDRWTDMDGKNHNKIKIVGEHVEFKPEFKKKQQESEGVKQEGEQDNEERVEQVEQAAEKEMAL